MPVLLMFRLLFRFLALVIFFAIVRYVFAAVAGLFSKVVNPPRPSPQNPVARAPMGGELKQDPVCGTFVPTATSVKQTINGELLHFCSVACRDKYKVA